MKKYIAVYLISLILLLSGFYTDTDRLINFGISLALINTGVLTGQWLKGAFRLTVSKAGVFSLIVMLLAAIAGSVSVYKYCDHPWKFEFILAINIVACSVAVYLLFFFLAPKKRYQSFYWARSR